MRTVRTAALFAEAFAPLNAQDKKPALTPELAERARDWRAVEAVIWGTPLRILRPPPL